MLQQSVDRGARRAMTMTITRRQVCLIGAALDVRCMRAWMDGWTDGRMDVQHASLQCARLARSRETGDVGGIQPLEGFSGCRAAARLHEGFVASPGTAARLLVIVIVNPGCAERTRGREPASRGIVNAGFAGQAS
jgi:hypothetical protein